MKNVIELILIDANNLGWRVYHTLDKNVEKSEMKLDFLFGFFNSLQKIVNKFDCGNVVFAWDHKKSHRKDEYPQYKERKRLVPLFNIHKQFEVLKRLLKQMGFRIFKQAGIEADDIIAKICEQENRTDKLIVSNDGDMRQCLDYFTWIYDGKKLLGKDEFSKVILGLDPKTYYPQIKALAGCPTDNVEGIFGVGELTAARWFADKKALTKRQFDLIKDNLHVLKKNLPLVKLPHKNTKDFKMGYNEIDKGKMIDVFVKYEFEWFLNNMDKWDVFNQ